MSHPAQAVGDTVPGDEPVVFVLDDDPALRAALIDLLSSVQLKVRAFGSAQDLLQSEFPAGPSCLVLDVRLPGRSGLDLQAELAKKNNETPIIFITGHGNVPMSVKAMKAGAVDFLVKPFHEDELLDAVAAALERDRKRRSDANATRELQEMFNSLTGRERDVMRFVTDGLLNKQVAHQMGISEITVKVYRGQVMRKMHARSLADLVRMGELLGVRAAVTPSPSNSGMMRQCADVSGARPSR
jgi:FixJ family two-component response regulator